MFGSVIFTMLVDPVLALARRGAPEGGTTPGPGRSGPAFRARPPVLDARTDRMVVYANAIS
jgi:hypothetical protein